MRNFAGIYQAILDETVSHGCIEVNKRTNTRIRMLPQGASFSIYLGNNTIPICGLRVTKPWHSAAEAAWCLMGHNDIKWLKKHLQAWNQFADKNDKLDQAYGARWKDGFDIDQLAVAIERLEKDSTDRRIWISSYHPFHDLPDEGQKTVPCPVGFSLTIMDSVLCSSMMIRSSDLYFGLPYDVMRHAFIMRAIGSTLGVGLGYMRVTLAHPHIYEPQWKEVNEMLHLNPKNPLIALPSAPIAWILHHPDEYVEMVKTWCQSSMSIVPQDWPQFQGTSKIVK